MSTTTTEPVEALTEPLKGSGDTQTAVPSSPQVISFRKDVDYGDLKLVIRLPNQFQWAEVREAAKAAKARRLRQLRDPESDAFVTLESDIEEIERSFPDGRAVVIDELVNRDWWKDHLEAERDVREDERFETIDADQARYDELREMEPDDRPEDEYEELGRHLSSFGDAVVANRDERQKPRREALGAMPDAELLQLVRDERIKAESQQVFNLEFSKRQMLVGTLNEKEKPFFEKLVDVERAEPGLISALADAYSDLESGFQRGLTGNS